MKRYIFVLLLTVFLIEGCAGNSDSNYNLKEKAAMADYTAKIGEQINIDSITGYNKVDVETCFGKKYYNVAEIADVADNVIVGEIVDIQYNDDNAIAKTFCSVAVNEVIKGNDIIENSIISVMELQGYCRLSKFIQVYGDAHFPNYDEKEAETLCLVYSIEGEPLIQIGEKYVFFLSPQLDKDSDDGEKLDNFEGNYYITKATFMGRYKLNKDGLYERYSPYDGYYIEFDNHQRILSEEMPLTLEEIKDIINDGMN